MGKYMMKKGKITGDVAVMECPPQPGLGVRTRAKTLALQQNPELSYLQLRSRRLEKPQFHPPSPQKQGCKQSPGGCSSGGGSRTLNSSRNLGVGASKIIKPEVSGSAKTAPLKRRSRRQNGSVVDVEEERKTEEEEIEEESVGISGELGAGSVPVDGIGESKAKEVVVEASFGENDLELDGNGRSTRESTPCSLIRDLGTTGTPVSAVRSSVNRRRSVQHSVQRTVPTSCEMDEFFATAEVQQQRRFTEKYNYDVVNDLPLSGRYEWTRVKP